MTVRIGTAGWAIPSALAGGLPAAGTTLQRYAARFDACEINSSFYRAHRPATWARWADSVPDGFRFSVKLPKTMTHERRLEDCGDLLAEFAEQVEPLGTKLGALLVQLPPSLGFDAAIATGFFEEMRRWFKAPLACEPRHAGWFAPGVDELLAELKVGRVAADPARVPTAALPGGWNGLRYWRLHGSPWIYRSSYGDRLPGYAEAMRAARDCWCIFDNTASGAALGDAIELQRLLES